MKMLLNLSSKEAQSPALAGGKGANLSRLLELPGVRVPRGFVITTEAFRALGEQPGGRSAPELRESIQNATLPIELEAEIREALLDFGEGTLFAVRSSATAEDLPEASFAGQQDSFLNVTTAEVPQAVLDCFASLYTDRAAAYREKNGYESAGLAIAAVVQEMVPSQVSGVLFTADPLTSDRFTTVIEAVEGLGDELVSGRKTPHTWRLRDGRVKGDGRENPPLLEEQLWELSAIGKRIELAFGAPQDIEWCFLDGEFHVVQSRDITTLYPLPDSPDGLKRIFVSAGHMQMMTDAMLPLGMSFMRRVAMFQMVECGGRLFIDITHDMKTAYGKKMIRQKMAAMDPLIHAAVEDVMARRDYMNSIPKGPGSFSSFSGWGPLLREAFRLYRNNDPADIDAYTARMERSVAALAEELAPLSGTEMLDAIERDQKRLMDVIYDPTGFGAVIATQYVIKRLDALGKRLTGEENLSNRLSKSVGHNVSSEMGLALSEFSDLVRDFPEAIACMERSGQDFSMDGLRRVEGGDAVADAFEAFLEKYGMRATGEIDISKIRFRENPAELVATILTNIRTLPRGHGEAVFDAGRRESLELAEQLVTMAGVKLGKRMSKKLRKYISFFRGYVGTREYPKYFWICRYDIYKQAVMREAQRMVKRGVLREAGDVFYLSFEELRAVIEGGAAHKGAIDERKKAYAGYARLTPPRVIFSDGEVPEMEYDKKLPSGALGGLAVSSGVVEGRARVISSIDEAEMERGDILVTAFTDPSWTPVFVSLAGLVTEIGGMMTHGAVITREYGLPAVVGVLGATRRIRDGDRIRVNGDEGYVEIL